MPLQNNLPLNNGIRWARKCRFHTRIKKKNLPPFTIPGWTSVTGIAKGQKSPCPPPPIDWNKINFKGGSRGLVYATSHNLPLKTDLYVQENAVFILHTRSFKNLPRRGFPHPSPARMHCSLALPPPPPPTR